MLTVIDHVKIILNTEKLHDIQIRFFITTTNIYLTPVINLDVNYCHETPNSFIHSVIICSVNVVIIEFNSPLVFTVMSTAVNFIVLIC